MNTDVRAKRRAVQGKIKQVTLMSDKEFLEFAKEVLNPIVAAKNPIGLVLSFPYDLRGSLEMKSFDSSPEARWTAFMNNAGTLCHVVCPEAEILIRLKFYYPIKHLPNWQMLQTVKKRVEDYIKI